MKITVLDLKRMHTHAAWVIRHEAGAPAGEIYCLHKAGGQVSGHCIRQCFVFPLRNSPSPLRVVILAALLLMAYKISPGETPNFWG